MTFKTRSILSLAAVAALSLATSANAAALLHLEVLGSTDGGQSYSNAVSVANGTQVQFEVVAVANVGATNGTKTANGTTDTLNALPSFNLTDGTGTFNSDTLASAFATPPSANAGTNNGSSISGIITSAGTANPSIDGNGAVILTGLFTTGTEASETISAALGGTTNGTAKFSGSLTALTVANTTGLIDFAGLTITTPDTSAVPAPSVVGSLIAAATGMFGLGALRRRFMFA